MTLVAQQKIASALRLYLVTDPSMCAKRGLIDTVCAAIEGGATMVQLRDKQACDDDLYHTACELKKAIDGRVPLILNDRVHIAYKAKLNGVHIGQGDMNVKEARRILGPQALIGLSIGNLEECQEAQTYFLDDLDYFGIGPVYPTKTKKNHAQPLGVQGIDTLAQVSKLPTVAIGGINLNNAKEIYNTSCDGIAVVSAICAAHNPKQAAYDFITL